MKNIILSSVMLATFAMAGCTTTSGVNNNAGNAMGTANEIGMNVFKAAVDNQCRIEIKKQGAWRLASAAMTDAQQEAIQSKVCGCVSEQAPQQVTIIDMGNAAIDPAYRAQLVTRVVTKSLQSCYGSIVKS